MDESLPRPITLLRSALLPDGGLVDVAITGDTVTEVAPAGTLAASAEGTLDLEGRLLLTAPAEPHAHLDKALSADRIDPPLGDLGSAIAAWAAYATTMSVDEIADRARTAALALLAAGTTAVRTHVDVLSHGGTGTVADAVRGARALVQVRDELADLMDIELVALAGPLAPDEHVEAVLDLGVDLVGGAPHLADDPPSPTSTDCWRSPTVAVSASTCTPTRASTDPSPSTTTPAPSATGRATGSTPPGTVCDSAPSDRSASPRWWPTSPPRTSASSRCRSRTCTCRAGSTRCRPPRGLTAIRALLAAGVRVAAGADNVRDPFNPVGRSDALETASLLVTAGHLTPDEAYAMVSDAARSVMGLPAAGPVVGARADLLAVAATSVTDAVANAPRRPDRPVPRTTRRPHRGAAHRRPDTNRQHGTPVRRPARPLTPVPVP
ncbi:amidohydrolase family protein [Curtobacterium sp. MCPF17_052]|uniref:amidohydrolase family protein n=1 Tax=Curtobacterium sp. MCPF17_052 TaxID=2175655 RepID=UPI0024DF4EFC|nr:amidohydrolase family protein [Curtobacterium sp. MCPF17_052]WIB13276.1 cytosine deaminase [Curtobacterium sp. MCPF17_052]